jgi:hypothetical protein
MTTGGTEHMFDLVEWMAWRNGPLTSTDSASVTTWPGGSSGLYRLLMNHPHGGTQLLPGAADDVWTRLQAGRETAEDGDELAEVCFRAAGRSGTGNREEQLALAAALLARFTAIIVSDRDVTPCVNCDVPWHPGRWPAAIRFCTRPGAVRTVAR